jgi:cohesin complex subunit SA-1/2
MLKIICDQLISLSSMAVANIRNAVTEAALTMGQAAVASSVGLRARCDSSKRQLRAEVSKLKGKPKVGAPNGPKYEAIFKQSARLDEALEALEELAGTFFNSIFVHRFKDSNESIRALCTRQIGDWLTSDPNHYFKDEYLKYIGWMCFDHSAAVRREALRSVSKLLTAESHLEFLSSFVERFIGRFVEIAVGDIDEGVALEMMIVMRTLQMKGMLDLVEEEALDLVDEVIFDGESSKRVRREALAFMMDHTEGFEDDDEGPDDSTSSLASKGKGGKRGVVDDARALAKKSKTAMQLETLTEFAEHHLYSNTSRCYIYSTDKEMKILPDLSRVTMMVEALLELPQRDIIRNWSMIISLLLKESDDFIAIALRPSLSSVLLRIFVASAIELKKWNTDIKALQLDDVKGMRKGKGNRGSFTHRLDADDQLKAEHWESLNEHLLSDLPKLLVRFRDDQANLEVLVTLLSCCDVSLSTKALKALLKGVNDLFENSNNEEVIVDLCSALRKWKSCGGISKGVVDGSIMTLLAGLWSRIEDSLQVLNGATDSISTRAAEMALNSPKKKTKVARKSAAHELADVEEAVYSLNSAVMKYKALWSTLGMYVYTYMNVYS